ncbi:MAG: N-acetylmuramoyl-L-alanine amidase [Rhodanobacteraceae bacterium]
MSGPALIHDWRLAYENRLRARDPADIDLVVIHCTELPDLATAREFGERILHTESGTGNCGHYYVDRDGTMHRFVGDERIAHHVFGHNERSIGIELVNRGRWPRWRDSRYQAFDEPYTAAQVRALNGLLDHLCNKLPGLKWIAGHEEIDLRVESASDDPTILLPRRRDPGPLFPWADVLAGTALQPLLTGRESPAGP